MTTDASQILYNLVREYMQTLGTARTTLVALESYAEAIRRLKCTAGDFRAMIERLNAAIYDTRPRIIPLVHLIEEFQKEMDAAGELPLETVRDLALEILGRQMERFKRDTATLTENCMQYIADGDLIIVDSPSATLREALIRSHTERRRSFRVLVLKQDFNRTRELVDALEQHEVPHVLVPEHNLSHYLRVAGKLFIGAVSVTSDGQAVTDIGTANVVSLCHWYHVPVYLFVESIKFAHKPLPEQHIHNEEKAQTEVDFTFHMKTFSHDFIDLHMVDHLVTEKGEMAVPKT